jgi:hypothetical protein
MKKTIRLTESDLTRIVKRVLAEDSEMMDVSSESDYYSSRKKEVSIPKDDLSMLVNLAGRFCEGKENFPDCKGVKRIYSKYHLYM